MPGRVAGIKAKGAPIHILEIVSQAGFDHGLAKTGYPFGGGEDVLRPGKDGDMLMPQVDQMLGQLVSAAI